MSVIVSVARGHNGSTTLLVDGKVVFYLEEERLSRFKYDGSPLLGIQKVFDYVDHIDHLVICHTHRHGPVLDWSGEDAYKGWTRKLARKKFEFQTHEIDTIHHEMHAACGFYNSGFETAACVIADGAGSFLQIGDIQDTCYEFETIFNASYPGDNLIVPTYPNAAMLNVSRYDILKEDVKNHVEGEYTDVQKDLAYKIQEQTSDRMVQLIKKAHELTGEKNIVICGGYGLNCVANYKYWKEFPDLNIYCEPISHDGGTSIGGAKYVYNKLKETEKPSKQESVYYGPQYDPTGYMTDLEGLEVTDTSYDDVAKLIREGTIVTIYQGRSEGGPRALGNRSILFDPTIKDGKDHVNAVKHREWFRPFACSIKKEAVHDWFDLAGRDETPHMMYAVKCHDGVEEKIPSVIHVDNTCRIQTVTPEQNEHYYNLIDAFDKIAGVPILFNTSFNLGGDPLVETIEDAVNTLNNSDIEWMYLPEIQKLVHVPNE